MYKKVKFFPHGFGFFYMVFTFIVCYTCVLGCLIGVFTPEEDNILYHSWFYGLLSAVLLIYLICTTVRFIKEGFVIFNEENFFIHQGRNPKYFPPINRKCEDFVDYKLTNKGFAQCIEFKMIDGKKIHFHTMQYTKKQNLRILQEIQNRGGLQGLEIKLDHYYI